MNALFAVGRLALFGLGVLTGVALLFTLFVWAYWLDCKKKEQHATRLMGRERAVGWDGYADVYMCSCGKMTEAQEGSSVPLCHTQRAK